eukprot:364394-Chlamydomonas_euryale.AAC.6
MCGKPTPGCGASPHLAVGKPIPGCGASPHLAVGQAHTWLSGKLPNQLVGPHHGNKGLLCCATAAAAAARGGAEMRRALQQGVALLCYCCCRCCCRYCCRYGCRCCRRGQSQYARGRATRGRFAVLLLPLLPPQGASGPRCRDGTQEDEMERCCCNAHLCMPSGVR